MPIKEDSSISSKELGEKKLSDELSIFSDEDLSFLSDSENEDKIELQKLLLMAK